MAKLTPVEIAAKYARNASAAVGDWQKGIESVVESPTKKAAAALPKARQNYIKRIDDGSMKAALEKITTAEWQAKCIEKGVSRYPQGVAGAESKVAEFHEKLQPFQEKISKHIANMPNLSLADSIARVTYQITEMNKFKKNM